MANNTRRKYLTINPADQKWGLSVNSVGHQSIAKNEVYPPQNHPTRYLFNISKGRVLNEYQLLYITSGSGTFSSQSGGTHKVQAGCMFLLFPNEWHSYSPDPESGWNEYWIGFNGDLMKNWEQEEFFSKEHPFFNVGLNEDLIGMYKRAIIIAEAQEANYQQALSGIACNLLGMSIYLSRNKTFISNDISTKINQAKMRIHEDISSIKPEDIAKSMHMSYSKFRKIFKEYTGFAPSQYIQEVKITLAKEMLTNTAMSIKEIAFELGYDNSDYFFTVFRKMTGITPLSYRKHTQGIDLSSEK
jgi:AraC-like DNA-binding protein